MEYPDKWVVLKVTNDDAVVTYKLLAGYRAGNSSGDIYWKINSSIGSIDYATDTYVISSRRGNSYSCHHDDYGFVGGDVNFELKEKIGDKELFNTAECLYGETKDTIKWSFDNDGS